MHNIILYLFHENIFKKNKNFSLYNIRPMINIILFIRIIKVEYFTH